MGMATVGGPPIGCEGLMLCVKIGYRQVGGPLSVVKVSHKFEHPKSTPYYLLILLVTHIYIYTLHYCIFLVYISSVYCKIFSTPIQ